MNDTHTGPVEVFLEGPRGRRFLLEYALASEIAHSPARGADSFGSAVIRASRSGEPAEQNGQALFGSISASEETVVTPADAAERLNRIEFLEPTEESLRNAISASAAYACYWEAPNAQDILAASPEMKTALRRVADGISASPLTKWWATPVARHTQQSVQRDDLPVRPIPDNAPSILLADSEKQRCAGRSPHRSTSAEWWSRPIESIPSSTRSLFDGSPAGLWFVEDDLGWERAESTNLIIPHDLRVFEIEDASDWADLCTRFPMDVTAQKRADWDRAICPMDRWIVPDWAQVAEHYDGVHLQVNAYLAAAGTAVHLETSGAASVIAGWGPDETYWFTPDLAYGNELARWTLVDVNNEMVWVPE